MSLELIVTIALAFFVVVSMVAGAASLYLLKIASDRNKSEHESGQPKARNEKNRAAPLEREIDVETFSSNENAGSPAPEGVRNQAIAAVQAWRRVMPVTSSEEWRKATEAGSAFNTIQMTQQTLGLTVPHLDYVQLISKSGPEVIEKVFWGTKRHSRSV